MHVRSPVHLGPGRSQFAQGIGPEAAEDHQATRAEHAPDIGEGLRGPGAPLQRGVGEYQIDALIRERQIVQIRA